MLAYQSLAGLTRDLVNSYRILATLPLLLLSSCATKFTAAQREALATVAIARTEVKSDAYSEPYGGDRGAAAGAAQVGASSGTGAIGGVVGALIGESIAASQNGMFRGRNKGSFAAVQSRTPAVGPLLDSQLAAGMKAEPFFASRIRNVSPNAITSKITSYHLVRNGKDRNGEILMAPRITVEMNLNDAAGKKMAGGTFTGTGGSNPISVYASSASKSKEGYELAAKTAVDQFTTLLAKKTAD